MGKGGIIFRVDGSRELGLGHVVRCLSIASALKIEPGENAEIFPINFVICDNPGARNVIDVSEFRDNVSWIPRDSDELSSFSTILDELQPRVVVTDIDLRGRVDEYLEIIHPRPAHISLHEHNYPILQGDRVIAPTIHPLEMAIGGTPGVTHFTGPEYLILSPDILELQKNAPALNDPPLKVLVTMGGGDPSKLTPIVLGSIRAYNNPMIDWTVVLGPASGYDKSDFMREFPARVEYIEGKDLPRSEFLERLADTDVVITNGGTTLYESLALGRPTIALPQNDFEEDIINILVKDGACVTPAEKSSANLLETRNDFLENAELRKKISEKGMKLIDGRGVMRVARLILEFM